MYAPGPLNCTSTSPISPDISAATCGFARARWPSSHQPSPVDAWPVALLDASLGAPQIIGTGVADRPCVGSISISVANGCSWIINRACERSGRSKCLGVYMRPTVGHIGPSMPTLNAKTPATCAAGVSHLVGGDGGIRTLDAGFARILP